MLSAIAAAAIPLGRSGAAAAETSPIVVELFTSQGCSACPPADAMMVDLAKRKGVIALSFNVGYWDYIGWKDTLAAPEHGARAEAFTRRLKVQSKYTPQMIVDGREDVIGNQRTAVDAAIVRRAAAAAAAQRVPVTIAATANGYGVSIGEGSPAGGKADIWLIRVQSAVRVTITAGENKNKTIVYTNAVRRLMHAGEWTGRAVTMPVPAKDPSAPGPSDGLAVLVQAPGGGPILGAAMVKL
jgi:hypothetical protein